MKIRNPFIRKYSFSSALLRYMPKVKDLTRVRGEILTNQMAFIQRTRERGRVLVLLVTQ